MAVAASFFSLHSLLTIPQISLFVIFLPEHLLLFVNEVQSYHFYLQQNDIVYVEPKYRKKDNEDRGWQIGTTILSVITAGCSVIWATK